MPNYDRIRELFVEYIVYGLPLDEASLASIKSNDNYRRNLTDEQINSLVSYDPLLADEKDNENIQSPFIQWLVNHFEQVSKENPKHIRDLLFKFKELGKKHLLVNINKQFISNPSDISQYRNLDGIKQVVELSSKNFENKENYELINFNFEDSSSNIRETWCRKIFSKMYPKPGEQISSLSDLNLSNDLEKLYTGNNIDIFQALTWKGSAIIKNGTKMSVCIGNSSTDDYFNDYEQNGYLLYVLDKRNLRRNYAIYLGCNIADELKDFNENNYKEIRRRSTLGDIRGEATLEIENSSDESQIPIEFFNDICPECFEFFKKNKTWLDRLKKCAEIELLDKNSNGFKSLTIEDYCKSGDLNKVKEIIASGKKDIDYERLLGIAASLDNTDIAKFLIENNLVKNLDVYYDGKHILEHALDVDNHSLCYLLVSRGVNLRLKDEHGRSLLEKLIQADSPTILRMVVKNGIDLNKEGEELLRFCALYNNSGFADFLIKNNVNVNSQDKDGNTPLMIAIKKLNPGIIILFLKSGADLTIKNKEGKTAIDLSNECPSPWIKEIIKNASSSN